MLGHYSKSFRILLLVSALILPLTSALEAQDYEESVLISPADSDGVLDGPACAVVDVSATRSRLSRILRKQRQVFKKLLRIYRRLSRSKYGKTIKRQAEDIYKTNVDIIAQVPDRISSCPENDLCVHISTDSKVLNYKANARGLDLLSKKLADRIDFLSDGTERQARVLRKQSKGYYKRSVKAVENLPSEESVC